MQKLKKILVAMSGRANKLGCSILLLKQGHDIAGTTMELELHKDKRIYMSS